MFKLSTRGEPVMFRRVILSVNEIVNPKTRTCDGTHKYTHVVGRACTHAVSHAHITKVSGRLQVTFTCVRVYACFNHHVSDTCTHAHIQDTVCHPRKRGRFHSPPLKEGLFDRDVPG